MQAIFSSLIKMVPQFYETFESKNCKNSTHCIRILNNEYHFNSLVKSSNNINKYLQVVSSITEEEIPKINSKKINLELIERMLVIKWLSVKGYTCDWVSLFDYVLDLESRTYENSSIGFTFKINLSYNGHISLFDPKYQKYMDVLGESRYTYFTTDKNWNYISYDFIDLNEYSPPKQNQLVPEFIYPYQKYLIEGEIGITKTKVGDLLIYDFEGLIATRRKGSWFIYEPKDLWESIIKLSPSNKIGENIFVLLLDISYRRHGALLIFCEDCDLKTCISNPSSIVWGPVCGDLHNLLAPKIKEICITCPDVKDISKPLIIELASIDGAIIFDKETGNIKAFGAMINHHHSVTNEMGARSTAALSAFKHNMIPFKVSSDGDICLYYNHHNSTNDFELVRINFL